MQISTTKIVFLRCMSLMYMFAFASLYIQIPGLYGENGILPAHADMKCQNKTNLLSCLKEKPTLLWFSPYLGLNTEYMMDVLAIMGMMLSFFGFVFTQVCLAPVFALLWILYHSLFRVGQTFLWFQWDMLLMEAGFICIFVAPLFPVRKKSDNSTHDHITLFLVRWLLFRLMFASGVVKLTSGCPTWWGLTALDIHFESQCIPTPLAWYAHHSPLWLRHLGVVATYVVEIPIPFLFFAPVRSVRLFAFWTQIILQVLIILTGNYNFFNMLTCVLCISLLDDKFFGCLTKSSPKRNIFMRWMLYLGEKILKISVYGGLLLMTTTYFNLRITSDWTVDSSISFTAAGFNLALKKAVSTSIIIGAVALVISLAESFTSALCDTRGTLNKIRAILSTLSYGAIAVFMFGISLVPYTVLDPTSNQAVLPIFHYYHHSVRGLEITNSYGLFRRMTGVDGRPEVIMEGSNSLEGPWLEYHFQYKPGDLKGMPPIVAPHQPRLDWQMWFAALGNYQYNPWIISLAHRLLKGQAEIVQLLDEDRNPFIKSPPKYIRATLYHYYYTSMDQANTTDWWHRKRQDGYMPIFSVDHQPLLDYLKEMSLIGKADRPVTHRRLKMFLDYFRIIHSQMDGFMVMMALFVPALAIIMTRSTVTRTHSTSYEFS